jgi:formylglycine-generating enzyme
MVLIPAGSFSMGDSFSEGYPDELPVHTVSVSAVHMDLCEVSKALWDEVFDWAVTNEYGFDHAGSGKAATHPVHTVSWYDVVKWCNARSQKEGRPLCYTVGGNAYRTGRSAPDCDWVVGGYRLPTEAEWEKAARGGASGHRFPWGDSDEIQHARANYVSVSSGTYPYDTSPTRGYHPMYNDGVDPYTSPVDSFEPNGYGLHNMAGNVWEWCWDWYGNNYYGSSPGSDPRGPDSGSDRMRRGGSWFIFPSSSRVAFRYGDNPSYVENFFGFRTVVSVVPGPPDSGTATVAYWQFDSNTSSPGLTDSVGAHDLTQVGSFSESFNAAVDPIPTPDSTSGFSGDASANPDPGNARASLLSSGNPDGGRLIVQNDAGSVFNLSGSSFTFEGWFQHDADSTPLGFGDIIGGSRDTSGGYTVKMHPDGSIAAFFAEVGSGDSFLVETTGTDYRGTAFHHFALTWQDGAGANSTGFARIYIDGILQASASAPSEFDAATADANDNEFRIAGRTITDNKWDGRLDEFRFSSRVLAPREFLLYESGGMTLIIR